MAKAAAKKKRAPSKKKAAPKKGEAEEEPIERPPGEPYSLGELN